MQVIRSLVQEGVILSDKLSPDQLGTWLLHHHFFGQLEISGEEWRSVILRLTGAQTLNFLWFTQRPSLATDTTTNSTQASDSSYELYILHKLNLVATSC